MSITALLIPVDIDDPVELIDVSDDYQDLSTAVGGYIEPIADPLHECLVWINEESILEQLPVNARATHLYSIQRRLSPSIPLVGPVVVTGESDTHGHCTSIPGEQIAVITDKCAPAA